MSQAGIIDVEGSNPQIPTSFVTDSGTAIPIANVLEILGTIVAAHSIPLRTTGSGNTVTIQTQYASAAGSSVGTNAGLASFNSAQFSVDANGYVSISGSAAVETFTVDAATAPGTNPVGPNGSGNITVNGGQVAAGTTANVIRTNSLVANTYTIQIQRSQAVASSTIGDNGVSHFNSTYFTVDANGFVSINGSAVGQTITGNTGGALSPTAGNWNILGTSTAPGTTPVQTSGTGSTLTVQVQKAQAIASTDATKVGLAAFNSSFFTVDSNGFVSLTGTGTLDTLTGDSGTATASGNNINVYGNTSPASTGLTFTGSGATLSLGGTLVVSNGGTGRATLTNYSVLVGAGTTAITQVGPSATTGAVLASNGAAADPSFQTIASLGAILTITGNSGGAESPTAGGNFNILGTGSITVAGSANTETVQLTGLTNHSLLVGAGTATITKLGVATNGQLPIGSAGADPVLATLTAGTGISITNGAGSITIASVQGGFAWSDTSGTVTAVAQNGYFITGTCTSTLPASPTEGDTVKYIVDTASLLTITGNTGQKIRIGTKLSAAAGTAVNTQQGDAIELVYRSTGTTWFAANNPVGGWNVT